MGRGRVQLKRIENKVNQQVTFSKRRSGLMKKAHEISVLCDADVGLIIFSNKGKLFDYSSEACMERILERYERCTYDEKQLKSPNLETPASWNVEHAKLKARIEVLQRNHSHYMGHDLDTVSLRELQNLEHQLEVSLKKIRSRKNQLMLDSISVLQKKDKGLQDQNNMLARQMKEKAKEVAQNNKVNSSYNLRQPSNSFDHQEANSGETNNNNGEEVEGITRHSNSGMAPIWMQLHVHHTYTGEGPETNG